MNKQVVILQITCPRYRIPFFSGLRTRLQEHGVDLRLLYGRSEEYELDFPDYFAELSWAEPFNPIFLPLRSATLEPVVWYPILTRILSADLIITEPATRNLINYLLCSFRRFGGPRVAFWGHGWNHFLDDRDSWAERIKHWMGKHADWYFAYTREVKQGLVDRGYSSACITNVQNAVASPSPRAFGADEKLAIREQWEIGPGDPVALYCGRMYAAKRLDFLIDAADRVHRDLPSFHVVFVGSGPLEPVVREAARRRSYVHAAGPSFGKTKHDLFAISRLFALPGRVGLSVVDALQYGVPAVATRYPYHSPEFSYLRHEENGLVSDDDVASFAQSMLRLASDDLLHAKLVSGCRDSARTITVEEMIARFTGGIVAALGLNRRAS